MQGSGARALGAIDIRNFGPIARGRLEILPLTVITGPNNSGKSYAALLVRSMFINRHPHRLAFKHSVVKTMYDHITRLLNSDNDHILLDPATTSKIIDAAIHGYGRIVSGHIERSFSARLETLIRIGSKSSTLQITTDDVISKIRFSSRRRSFTDQMRAQIKRIKLVSDPGAKPRKIRHSVEGSVLSIRIPSISPRLASFEIAELMAGFVAGREVFYLPAARSGILQGHKTISASIVRNAHYAGLEDVEIPKLSGVVSDFIGDIIEIPRRRGPFYEIASELEQEILRGQIKAEHRGFRVPEIKYEYEQRDLSMHLSSSTVSELAPFILYLKHKVDKDSILIMEEPESHLHPGNQSILARFLVRLIRQGLTVVITTHSPFMLEQLNNLIQAGSIPRRRGLDGFMADNFMTKDKVAAYVFESSEKGHIIRRMPVSATDGIPTEEFVKVTDALYRECLKIQDSAGGG